MEGQDEKQKLFIGALAHEFKTPLAGILLNTDNLINTYMSEDERYNALSSIETQANYLNQTVCRILRLLAVHHELNMIDFSVSRLIDDVSKNAVKKLMSQGITLDVVCEDFVIRGDCSLLTEALLCLIDNAANASEQGQHIAILAKNRTVEIQDWGCGIPSKAIPHVTEPFYVVESSRNKKRSGVGLGLALAKEIISAHNAKLEVESEMGCGTIVRIGFR